MIFDKSKTEYPTYVHMIIHKAAINLTSLEMSLSGMEDPSLINSCTQFYHFMRDLLGDLYENADAYVVRPGELEAFLSGRAINAMKQREPQKTNARLSTARNAAALYQHFLYFLGEHGESFKRYFLRHLNYCTACSTSHIGGITDIFGYRKRICCCPNPSFRIHNPSADDLENIKKMIQIRLEAVEAQKKPSVGSVSHA